MDMDLQLLIKHHLIFNESSKVTDIGCEFPQMQNMVGLRVFGYNFIVMHDLPGTCLNDNNQYNVHSTRSK